MKLRLRSIESNQTLKIQIPNPSSTATISQLKRTLISQFTASSSSTAAAAAAAEDSCSVYLSLNKKDMIGGQGLDDGVMLESIGITSGDLVYYSFDGNAFAVSNLGLRESLGIGDNRGGGIRGSGGIDWAGEGEEPGRGTEGSGDGEIGLSGNDQGGEIGGKFEDLKTLGVGMNGDHGKVVGEHCFQGSGLGGCEIVGVSRGINEGRVVQERERSSGFEYGGGGGDSDESEESDMSYMGSDADGGEEGEDGKEVENMDVEEVDASGVRVEGKKFSEQGFLRRVLRAELGGDVGNHKLVVIAVHAAFLEAGFVGIDSVSGMRVDRFFLADQWPSLAFGMSLWYTLPDILGNGKAVESVSLRFQSLGQFVNVYGGIHSGCSGTYRVCLDEGRFRPALAAIWGDRDLSSDIRQNFESEVFEFWKIVKDGLALPLMIDLCDKAGLMPPPCFMCLPTELKFKILESLTGVDIAKVACVCTELKFLSCSNDLWKKKFAEEFGNEVTNQDSGNWREKFTLSWELSKRRKRALVPWQPPVSRRRGIRFPRIIREPEPLIFPEAIGGDYDRLPGLGVPPPFGRRPGGGAFLRHPARRSFLPSCNLGGFNV